jgi:hypothetical protein
MLFSSGGARAVPCSSPRAMLFSPTRASPGRLFDRPRNVLLTPSANARSSRVFQIGAPFYVFLGVWEDNCASSPKGALW